MDYTKGKWSLDYVIGRIHAWNNNKATPIASLLGSGNRETFANGYLISAAPDMYEFCRELLMSLDTGYERLGAGREGTLRKALAKAEGKVEK